jgi:hypothetical protein
MRPSEKSSTKGDLIGDRLILDGETGCLEMTEVKFSVRLSMHLR